VSDDLSIPGPTYRVPRHRQGMDPVTKRLALIAGGLGATLVLVVGGSSLISQRSAPVPVVQADSRPVRVKPENPGGMQVAGANEDILSGGSEAKVGKLAPPPETPAPQEMLTPPPPPPVAAAPAQLAAPVPAPNPAPAPAATIAAASPKPVIAKPAVAPDKRPVAAPATSGALVQLAAVHSEEAARSEWDRLSKRVPDLLGPHKPTFSKIDHDGHSLWRVRTGGFSDTAQATSFCERLRAKGLNCSVADF
jgi:cell division septation protein DedD